MNSYRVIAFLAIESRAGLRPAFGPICSDIGVAHSWDDTVVGVVPECLPCPCAGGSGFGATTGGLPLQDHP